MINKCPGQDKKDIKAEIIGCPKCGYEVELFSDEIKAKCPKCQAHIYRETLPTCIDWCKYAKECVGNDAYNNYIKNKSIIIKDKLIKELEEYFGKDELRIEHAKKVMSYAEELLRKEGGDWHIVVPASILHDVGIKVAEEKYASSADSYQEKEGPAIAGKMLLRLGVKKGDIDEICRIIAYHHSPCEVDTLNFKILYDADYLVNLKEEVDLEEKEKAVKIINKVFFTNEAKEIARKIYL